jgi:hypothetical protein
MHLANDLAGVGIYNVEKVGRAAFPGRNVQKLPVRMNRQSIDIGINSAIPEHHVIVDIKAVDHPDARASAVGHVELAGRHASGDPLHVVHVANGLDGLD